MTLLNSVIILTAVVASFEGNMSFKEIVKHICSLNSSSSYSYLCYFYQAFKRETYQLCLKHTFSVHALSVPVLLYDFRLSGSTTLVGIYGFIPPCETPQANTFEV